ncbi:MAG: rod-binding protein [Candidatus Eremiobacteraeota bacterium]|nr:rod-binding protein [Candidatus Eremiobacteraeota bacterium]
MSDLERLAATSAASQPPELTAAQKAALARLHTACTQFEGVFLDMMFKAMRETVPQDGGIFGKQGPGEETFTEMLDEQRSQSLAQSGTLGIAKVLENQLRASVLGNAERESKTQVNPELGP